MDGLRVYRAGIEDAERVLEACLNLHDRDRATLETAKAFLAQAHCFHFLAERGGRILGSLYGYRFLRPGQPHPEFLLYEIDVDEDVQRQGIGKALVLSFKEAATMEGAKVAWVLTNRSNVAAQRLYEICGGAHGDDPEIMYDFPL